MHIVPVNLGLKWKNAYLIFFKLSLVFKHWITWKHIGYIFFVDNLQHLIQFNFF